MISDSRWDIFLWVQSSSEESCIVSNPQRKCVLHWQQSIWQPRWIHPLSYSFSSAMKPATAAAVVPYSTQHLKKIKQSLYRPEGSRFQDNWYMKVVRLSALCTCCLYPLVLISVRGRVDPRAIVQPKDYGNEKFQWNHHETIRDLPTCPSTNCTTSCPHRTPAMSLHLLKHL
jgi:hypothetical protein